MQFEWDSANIEHIARHNITPEEAEQVMLNEPFDTHVEFRNGERRTAHLGETDEGRVIFVFVTERNGKIRVVTAYDADHKARRYYRSLVGGNSG